MLSKVVTLYTATAQSYENAAYTQVTSLPKKKFQKFQNFFEYINKTHYFKKLFQKKFFCNFHINARYEVAVYTLSYEIAG